MFRSKFRPSQNSYGGMLFICAALIGATAILVMKSLGINQVFVTMVPCAILVTYAAIGTIYRGARLRIDQTADNCYYLGFIYTLVSLAYSLWIISDPREEVRSIITNFGIAIASTIVGLVLRVALSQMRQDPYEIEQQTRTELATTARRLRVQLDQSVAEFSLFSRELRQVLEEGMEETQRSIDSMLAGGMARFSEGVEEMTRAIESSNNSFEERNAAILESSDRLVSSISTLGERIDSVRVSEDVLVQQLGPAVGNLFKATEQVATASSRVADSIKEIHFPTEVIDDGLVRAISSLKDGADALKATAADERNKAQDWKASVENIARASDSLRASMSDVEGSVSGLRAAVSEIAAGSKQMDRIPASLDGFQDKLDALIRLMQKNLDQQTEATQRLKEVAVHPAGSARPHSSPRGLLSRIMNSGDTAS